MKKQTTRSSGGKLRALFCVGLSAILAAGIAFGSVAAGTETTEYDITVKSSPTHTVALSQGKLYAWGTNERGQIPGFSLAQSYEPVELQSSVSDVAVSSYRTLTVSKSGYLYSYGVEPADNSRSPEKGTLIAKDAAQAAASETFAAYVSKSGALYTWGQNTLGQLGNGSTANSDKPVKIIDSGVTKVALGESFGLALTDSGDVYGWGSNGFTQLGSTTYGTTVSTPVKIAEGMQDISAGSYHTCLLDTKGSLWTCGDNQFSQTGVGSGDLSSSLTKVLTKVSSVSAGSLHNFAIGEDGTVYAWGYGVFGQLGSGGTFRLNTPTVADYSYVYDFVQVFACSDNTFGVSSDGSVYSFGSNDNYRLGKTDGTNSLSAMRILDSEMNWVYEESLDSSNGHTHGGMTDSTTDIPNTDGDPEIVSTPFASGSGDGTFRPEANMTRAEFLRMLVSALCEDFDPEADYGSCSFSDVPIGKWYEKYIAYAEQQGYISGYGDGTVRPTNPITRGEASVLLAKFLGLDQLTAADAGFTDVPYKYYAANSINILVSDGTLHGYNDGTFRPDNTITRSEATAMVAQAAQFRPTDTEKNELAGQFPTSPFSDVSPTAWYYTYVLRAVGYVE